MTDMPITGKLIILSPDHPRLKHGIRTFIKYSDSELVNIVKEYERWRENGEFRLNYTLCSEIACSENEDDLFEVYDAVCREIARRAYYAQSTKPTYL